MKIYIHPGLSKTGSTAIQKYLYENANSLEKIGYYYPKSTNTNQSAPDSYHSSGNGYDLYLQIKRNSLDGVKKRNIIKEFVIFWINEAHFKNCENIIISSEAFCTLQLVDIDFINKVLIELKINFSYVYYIRQPYNWMFSSWVQEVKINGVSNWISEILDVDASFALQPLAFPETIKKLTSPEACVEHKYENVYSNLIGSFLTALGIPLKTQNLLPQPDIDIVNRSLTDHEFAISFYTNKSSQGNVKLSELLSSLIKDDNNLKDRNRFFFVDKYALDRLIEWCRSNSPRIFEAYSNDLSLIAEEAIPVSEFSFRKKLLSDQLYSISAIEKVVEFYSAVLDEASKLAHHKCVHYSNSEFIGKVPADFNIFMYLIVNSDVLFSSNDPYQHYFLYGKLDNRVYKF